MKIVRNFIFLFTVLFLFTIDILYLKERFFSREFYFISLNLLLSFFIVINIIYTGGLSNKIENMEREIEKQRLTIQDYKLESNFLSTLTDIIETFGKEISLDEVIDKLLESIKNLFKEETVVICLFGDRYKLNIKGKEIDLPLEIIEEIVMKPKPMLVNNISSFPQYKKLSESGITSFIISGLYQKGAIVGILCIFSFRNKKFSLRDLNLLRMVSAPISLMIENTELFDKTKFLSITDGLTQLYNRRHFEKLLSDILTKSQINSTPASIAMCDVDFFKFYNDTNGHLAGDYVLKTIADILKKGVKGSDIIGRYGGEEFIILFPDTTKENTIKICEKLRKSVKDFKFPNEESQPNGDLTISFGVASFPEDGTNATEIIKKADMALYKAKSLGKDKVIAA
ncbi:MAG: sensor domain-containing diguanylate cyclase [Candidatus Omnitrophica bacterium]|nr:sensor domain-containing diguanylate cyclase [Candidatus Omnitrophota bacterium]